MNNLLQRIALTQVKGLGPVLARMLVSECGGVTEIFERDDAYLKSIPRVTESIISSIRDPYIFERAEQELNFITKNDITPLFYLDKAYPNRLEFCADAPLMIYTKGNLNLNSRKVIAVVGTRNGSAYGKDMCYKIINDLAPFNPLIISGLAMGIDITAHKAALENNLQTIGVLAHGVDSLYPPSSRSVGTKMLSHGGVISEYMSGTMPARENFPSRNRIIAGACDAIIIVESKKRGGSIISADLAYSYHKEVFAVPGKASDMLSEGCNDLIKYQKAIMITNGHDVAREMNWSVPKEKNKQHELFPELTKNEKTVLENIRQESSIGIDTLKSKTALSASDLAVSLLQLEFNGLIRALPGKTFESA